jgi:16S rRNA (guanine966-N2)-methyltransferase
MSTRPTTDRVRESVFARLAAWLGVADSAPDEQLAGKTFLDLYAGSGAVGLEAVSRGAQAEWVEKDPVAVRVIRSNLATLGVVGQVWALDVARFLAGSAHPYDIVWLDPPYARPAPELGRVLAAVAQGWVAEDGIVVLERSGRGGVEFPESFLRVESRRYGDTIIDYAEKG